MGCVYCATNRINGKKYIGKTIGEMSVRRKKHENRALQGYMEAFRCALRKYGFNNFQWDVLFESNNEKILNIEEIYYIKEQNTKPPNGYNMTNGGDGLTGITDKTRKKMSESHKGKKQTQEQIEYRSLKIREAKRKNPVTKETRQKLSEANKGKKCTEETKKKISEANKGKKRTEETKFRISRSSKGRYLGVSFEERYGEKRSEEIKDKIRKKLTGRKIENVQRIYSPLSEEHKIKISVALKGKKKPIRSEEHKRKISESNKGKKCSEETKAKMRKSHRLRLLIKGDIDVSNC